MLLSNEISEKAQKKLQLYSAAMFLFGKGKSHPQIVRLLEQYEPDLVLLTNMVDKAMQDEWDKLYLEAQNLFAKGLIYDEVLQLISQKEPDEEIAKWICMEWYKLKSFYVDCITEGVTNRFEGMRWMLISALGLLVLYFANSSWISKTIWLIAFVGSTFQWIVGMQQRDLATRINRLFSTDIDLRQENDQ
jgi:hypothetical protein